MRPATHLLKLSRSKTTGNTTRTLASLTPIRTRAKMSAPGIPSTTAPLSQNSNSTQVPPQSTQTQSQATAFSTSSAAAAGAGPGVGSGGVGNAGLGGSGVGSAVGGAGNDAASYGITSTDLKTAAGVELSPRQKVLVGGVLDLFKGLPTHKKMSLWSDDATFADPLTKAQGRKQYEAQWWGLKAAFSEIEQQSHTITSAGNPITLDLKTRYKVKGIGSEKVIESVIKIFTEEGKGAAGDGEKIVQVEDRWNGNIPEGAIATAFRNLNSVVVPAFVTVPKKDEEN